MGRVDELRQNLTTVERNWHTAVAERNQAREELALVKEELRSLNEEIEEVSVQNRKLRRLNDELSGLLNSTAIPILMIDTNMIVRRMTPAAEHAFNVRPADVGRHVADLRPCVDGNVFKALLSRILEGSAGEQAELVDRDGEWNLLTVRPYLVGRRLEGAMFTMTNIEGLRGSTLESLVESIPGALLVLSRELRIVAVSRDFLISFGLSIPNVVDLPVCELHRKPFDSSEFREAIARLSAGVNEFEELELLEPLADGGERVLFTTARRIHHPQGHQFLVALRDVTSQKNAHRVWARALLDTEDALRLSHLELQSLTGRLLHAQDEERRRLSRELHDDLSQNIVALQLDVELLAKRLPPDLDKERKKLAAICDSAEQLSNDLRRIAHGLHPSTLEVLGLAPALENYAEEFSMRTGILVQFTAANIPDMIPPEIAGSFYRIAQEALRNIARHVGAGSAVIGLTGEESLLRLSITDQGPGFDRENVRRGGGLGLVSMEERARLIRAKFDLETAPGKGVSITVSAPLR